MDSNISISNNNLIFESISNINSITYTFLDDIGEFSKKYSLNLLKCENTIQLNLLNSFGKGIDNSMKIVFNILVNKKIDIEFREINPFYIIFIYNENNKLIIELKEKNNLLSQKIENNELCFYSSNDIDIVLRKMISIDSKYHLSEQKINCKNQCLTINEVVKKIKNEAVRNQAWKVFVKLYDSDNNNVYVEAKIKDFYENNKNLFEKEYIYYNNSYNSIIYNELSNEKEMVISKLLDTEENIIVIFNNLSEEINLYICIRNRQSNPFDFQEIKMFSSVQNIIIIPKIELSKLWMKNGDNIELLIGKNLDSAKFIELDNSNSQKYDYFNLSNELSYKFYKNGRNAISIYVKELVKNVDEKTVKIAVLGTCFSRNAFNSTDFFNPNYKKYFNCVFTQFHSTIGSLISKPAPQQCVEVYSDSNDYKYIKTDMRKTFFEELRIANPDYLIIDLYADAMLQELQLINESIITYNYMIKEKFQIGDYVVNWGDKYKNEKEFFNNWKKSIHIFMGKIKDIIPVENIILNRGRLSEKYYNENGYLTEFGTKDLIKRNNYYWERLDNLFLSEFPDISCIDLTDKEFYSVIDYPFGFSFSHYESDYYKSFLNELMNIIFLMK